MMMTKKKFYILLRAQNSISNYPIKAKRKRLKTCNRVFLLAIKVNG